MIVKFFWTIVFSFLFFPLCLFAEIKPYLSAELDGLFSMGLRSSKGSFIVFSNDEIFSGGYGTYRPVALRFSSESKLETGFVWRGDGKLAGHSFFGVYQISYIDLVHSSFNERLFDDYWSSKRLHNNLQGYSTYLLPNLKRFLLHWKQLPVFDEIVAPKQLNNQMMASYSYSILNSLDISTAFAFSSFLTEEDWNKKKSDGFKRTEFYTAHFNIFLRPLVLRPRLNLQDDLEMTLFLTYGYRSMPNAKIFLGDMNNLAQGIDRKLDHDANFFRGEIGFFHSKKLEKMNIDSFLQYEHHLFIYAGRTGIARLSDDSFLMMVGDNMLKNIMKVSLFTSLNFFLSKDRYVGPQRLPTEFVLNLGYSFSSRNSDVGLWEYDQCGCVTDARFPNFFHSLSTTPFVITDARLFDYFKHQMTTEIEYHFYKTLSFFVAYQFSFLDYSKLVELASVSDTIKISRNDDKEIRHAFKLGFRFVNSFIENIEPYFLFSRNTSGKLIPKENLDFLGVGIKFRYRLDAVSK